MRKWKLGWNNYYRQAYTKRIVFDRDGRIDGKISFPPWKTYVTVNLLMGDFLTNLWTIGLT
jgi:hypothetical protein